MMPNKACMKQGEDRRNASAVFVVRQSVMYSVLHQSWQLAYMYMYMYFVDDHLRLYCLSATADS